MSEIPAKLMPLASMKSLGQCRSVYRTEKGILKFCAGNAEAAREVHALLMAHELLNGAVRVPRLLQHDADWLLLEDLGEAALTTEEHFRSAAEYLASLHRVDVSVSARGRLVDGGFCHYWGESLRNRLRQEIEFARRAHLPLEEVARFRDVADSVAALPVPPKSDVLGHGDPRIANFLLTSDGTACAIDWHDFGLSNRWYEVAHFIDSIEEGERAAAVIAYQSRSGLANFREWESAFRYGAAVNYVIRAGFWARTASRENPEAAQRFMLYVRRLSELARSLAR